MTNSNMGNLGGANMPGSGLNANTMKQQQQQNLIASLQMMPGGPNQQNQVHSVGLQNGPPINRVAVMQQQSGQAGGHMGPRTAHMMGGPRMQAPNMPMGKFFLYTFYY